MTENSSRNQNDFDESTFSSMYGFAQYTNQHRIEICKSSKRPKIIGFNNSYKQTNVYVDINK